MKVYNKLVRDKIPEIIARNGGKPETRTLYDDKEFLAELNKKLQEEVTEYFAAPPDKVFDELADIAEVLEALLGVYNISLMKALSIKNVKAKERGSFTKRIFLESVEE